MSSEFETALRDVLGNEVSVSENGSVGFKTTSSKLLDINFAAASLRNKTDDEIRKMFYENPILACRWLFMLRDIRCGIGERRSFRICMKWLADIRPDMARSLVRLIPEYGRFDDLFCLIGTNVESEVVKTIVDQWTADLLNMKDDKPISLLAKWMPSANASSRETVKLGRFFCRKLCISEKTYRKTLSAMRKHLNVVEQKMSAKLWSEIDYEAVPSNANLKYKDAFLRNDELRRTEFLKNAQNGRAKINSTACFPVDIVHDYVRNIPSLMCGFKPVTLDHTLEAMWKSLPNVAVNGNVLAVLDGSGSMGCQISSATGMTAWSAASALAIYCAERCTGPFKDKYITFSRRPQYVDMTNAKALAEKLDIAARHNECANTNIEATFDLVLRTAVEHGLKQGDIPTLVILSDMEFDDGSDFGAEHNGYNGYLGYDAHKLALMEKIRMKYAERGLSLPRTIWWNINSRTGTIPMTRNSETGVVLCSGYSQSQFKLIASNKTDPYEVLVESLNVERYDPVELALKPDAIENGGGF